jgi:hypothetical protein
MTERSMAQSFRFAVRHPKRWMRELCGGEAAFPLVVLFGLNAVDELDRTAFGILLPEIRDAFGIDIQTALTLVALSSVAALALQVPIAQWADRTNRIPLVGVRCADVGAVLRHDRPRRRPDRADDRPLGVRARQGGDRPDPQLADRRLLPDRVRSRVYSFHRAANAVGAFVGPLSAGCSPTTSAGGCRSWCS